MKQTKSQDRGCRHILAVERVIILPSAIMISLNLALLDHSEEIRAAVSSRPLSQTVQLYSSLQWKNVHKILATNLGLVKISAG